MKAKQPKKRKPKNGQLGSIPFDAAVWLKNFVVDIEENFEASVSLMSTVADTKQLQELAAQAAVHSLVNSGMDMDSLHELLNDAMKSQQSVSIEWDDHHNQRRIELIDKDIQGLLTQPESVELARLTKSMREYLQVHHPLEMEGTRKLHQKLITLRNTTITELK